MKDFFPASVLMRSREDHQPYDLQTQAVPQKIRRYHTLGAGLALLMLVAHPVAAESSASARVFVSGGVGDSGAAGSAAGFARLFAPFAQWPGAGTLCPGWELSGSFWSGDEPRYNADQLRELGLSLLLRLQGDTPHTGLFLEGAVGLHYLAETRFENNNLGIHAQAGTSLALGWYVPATQLELSLRGRHLSNGGLDRNNAGFNEISLRVAIRL